MMMLIVIIIVALLIAGIVFLGDASPFKRKSRIELLQSLAKFLDARLEPIEEVDNSFRIRFLNQGRDFVYEDFEEKGIQTASYNSYLKLSTPSRFSLYFTERSRGGSVRSNLVLISRIDSDSVQKDVKLDIPNELKDFNIHSNNPALLNELLHDAKIVSIFSAFKNIDNRGHPFITLKIIEGTITLEFPPSGLYHPPPLILQHNFHALEVYLGQLSYIARKLVA